MIDNYKLVFVTCKNREEAELISNRILKGRLAACCNIISNIQSSYWWKGNIEQAEEALLILKTRHQRISQLIKEVKKLHSYDVPEIIALPIESGNRDYLKWIGEETKKRNYEL